MNVKFRLVITVCQQKETSIFDHETRHKGVEKKVLEAKPSNAMLFVTLT